MPDVELAPRADDAANRLVERRTGRRTMHAWTRQPQRVRAAAVWAVALGLIFCGFGSSAAQAQTACPAGVRCGVVTVPLDRANATAGTIDIRYALVPHTNTSRPALGTIVPNPGGPGQSTIAFAGLYLDALAPLRARRDLLLIDPRGTGGSGALSCPRLAGNDPLSL